MNRLFIHLTPGDIPSASGGAIGVVIDVLRFSTVYYTAMKNGAAGISTVCHPQEAFDLRRAMQAEGKKNVLLCGERNSVLIPGFDIDNSPLRYTEEAVKDAHIVITTTNGTRAMKAAESVGKTLVCCLHNRRQVAMQCVGNDVHVICSGEQGGAVEADEDSLVACLLAEELLATGEYELANPEVFGHCREVKERYYPLALKQIPHAAELVEKGFEADVDYAFGL